MIIKKCLKCIIKKQKILTKRIGEICEYIFLVHLEC